MQTDRIEQQMQTLRTAVQRRRNRRSPLRLQTIGGVLVVLGFGLLHPVPVLLGALLLLIGVAEQRIAPNVERAVAAYDAEPPRQGKVEIIVARGETHDHYQVVVREAGFPDWTYEFAPRGWRPVSGIQRARIWRDPESGAPLLAATDDGVMTPRRTPHKWGQHALEYRMYLV